MLTTMKSTVNERIRLLRSSLKLNQVEFANELGISPSLISKVEAGDSPSANTLDKIVETYLVPERWLLKGEGDLSFEKRSKEQNPYKDVLYKELRDQVEFLRETIKALTGGGKSFRQALNGTGFHKRKSLRAAA